MSKSQNRRSDGFIRTNSICPTPEAYLLKLVQKNDCEKITKLVETNRKLLSQMCPDYNRPILSVACSNGNIEPETVKTLIDLGADLYFSNDTNKWQALHYAANKRKSNILKVIIDSLKNPDDINATAEGNNALHIVIKSEPNELTEELVECVKILVERDIDVNQGDCSGISAILWAADKGYKEVIEVILKDSKVPVDIDYPGTDLFGKKTARDIIVEKHLYNDRLPEKIQNNNELEARTLFRYLYLNEEDTFIDVKNGDISDLVNTDNGNETLLQYSCSKGMKKAVDYLINLGADPNLTTKCNGQTPVEIAAKHGYHEIFQILLNLQNKPIPQSVLTTLLKYIDGKENVQAGISYAKCYDILLTKCSKNNDLLDINNVDNTHNSPLHYAVRYADALRVQKLLNLGASLGSKDKFGVMPIQNIEPGVLEKHLNDCIKFDEQENEVYKEDFKITFDYRTLMPPSKKIESNVEYQKGDIESNKSAERELVAETEVISFMSKTTEFKHLLKHPVIVSFLFMKWYRIRWLFYINLAFYITFFSSLTVYILLSYANFDSDNISSFQKFVIYTSWIILSVTFLILVLREVFQITISPNKYFKNFENYIEIILIIFTGSILCINDPSNDTKKILSSISILLAAFELVLMVGQHPKFSTNVVMFRTVSFNFFKFLIWYSLLIIAFALSFYILFTNTGPAPKSTTGTEETKDDSFTDPLKSIFKTVVMLTGEFDAGSLNFERFPVTSKIIFSLFVFMIAIILLNLLNGLAVSDTQMIKNNAELVGHIARAQHIRYVESMILGNILPSKLIRAINNICCCIPEKNNYTFEIFKPLAKRVCLFPHFLKYELRVYPNKGKICVPSPDKKDRLLGSNCYVCHDIYLDKDTVKRTNNIVRNRKEVQRITQEDNYLQRIENINDKLEILNKKLDDVINNLNQKN